MKILSMLLQYSRGAVLLTIIAGIISGASNTGLLVLINYGLTHEDARTSNLIAVYVALCVTFLVARFISDVLLSRLGQKTHFDLRMKLSSQILAAPLRHLEEIGASRLLASLTEDVPVITGALLTLPNMCISLAVVTGCLIYLGLLSWAALVALLFMIALGVLSYQFQVKKAERAIKVARDHADVLIKHFRAMTDGMKELKLHHRRRQAFYTDGLRKTATGLREHNVRGLTYYAIASSWGQTLTFIALGLLIFIFPRIQSISRETLASFTITLLYTSAFIPAILGAIPTISRANISLKKVEDLGLSLAAKTTESELAGPQDAAPDWQNIELISVTHTYYRERENSKFTLGPINLSFTPGELVFIIGGNGSGKTTLAKLLTGLYAPEEGEIRRQRATRH